MKRGSGRIALSSTRSANGSPPTKAPARRDVGLAEDVERSLRALGRLQ
jgi:hypothetical protein